MMESPEAMAIARVKWQLFGHHTFPARDEGISAGRQLRAWFAFVREIARASGVPFKSVPWVLRPERGDLFGKEHFHSLITGLPAWNLSTPGRFAFMNTWESIGGGMARVALYDHTQAGVDYVCKCLGGMSGGRTYEAGKFGQTGELIYSHAAMALLRKSVRGVRTINIVATRR